MNVIDFNILERDAGGKPLHTFPHPALAESQCERSQVIDYATWGEAIDAGPCARIFCKSTVLGENSVGYEKWR